MIWLLACDHASLLRVWNIFRSTLFSFVLVEGIDQWYFVLSLGSDARPWICSGIHVFNLVLRVVLQGGNRWKIRGYLFRWECSDQGIEPACRTIDDEWNQKPWCQVLLSCWRCLSFWRSAVYVFAKLSTKVNGCRVTTWPFPVMNHDDAKMKGDETRSPSSSPPLNPMDAFLDDLPQPLDSGDVIHGAITEFHLPTLSSPLLLFQDVGPG